MREKHEKQEEKNGKRRKEGKNAKRKQLEVCLSDFALSACLLIGNHPGALQAVHNPAIAWPWPEQQRRQQRPLGLGHVVTWAKDLIGR